MKNWKIATLAFLLSSTTVTIAQDNVGIGTTTPAPSAILELSATNKGVLIPRVALTSDTDVTTIPTPATSLLVFNTNAGMTNGAVGYWYYDGAKWAAIAGPGSTHNTLNAAYNEGGPGAGRVITANNGEVEINHTSTTNGKKAIVVTTTQNESIAVDAANSGNLGAAIRGMNTGEGLAIAAYNTNANSPYAALEVESNSTHNTASAIMATHKGAGNAITGQIPATATGFSAVSGSNFRTTGGVGVLGTGYNGVAGETDKADGYGVFGQNLGIGIDLTTAAVGVLGQSEFGVGVRGIGDIGVLGQTVTATGLAGLFTGDVEVNGGVYATGPGQFNLSDQRLKSNIVNIDRPLDKIMQLNAKHYTIKTKSFSNIDIENGGTVVENIREEYGLIAQELEKVFPEMISEKAFFKYAGDETKYKAVNYVQLIPVAIEAIKELNNKVDTLEKRLSELESQLKK